VSRKDYREIARAIRDARLATDSAEVNASLDRLVGDLCGILKRDNARFDPYRFRDACER